MEQRPWNLAGGDRSVGQVLADERRRTGMSQAELARRLGISQTNISRFEHGGDMRVSTMLDIARALGLEPMLVPKRAVASVRSVLRDVTEPSDANSAQRGRFA